MSDYELKRSTYKEWRLQMNVFLALKTVCVNYACIYVHLVYVCRYQYMKYKCIIIDTYLIFKYIHTNNHLQCTYARVGFGGGHSTQPETG